MAEEVPPVFGNHFVLYEPKSIVSGDFYWFSQIGDESLLAVIDCTGHGVPGAFMSLLTYSLLNEIVNTSRLTDPGEILNALNSKVNHALGNTKKRSKGGMDIGICKIVKDHNQFQLSYAGAKTPLYYVEKGRNIEKVKGDRFSIGVVNKSFKSYQTKIFLLDQDSILYVATDGYIDMPNSERKKFGTPNFIHLLNSMSHLPMAEQQVQLKEQMSIYCEGTAQRDDITVIGAALI